MPLWGYYFGHLDFPRAIDGGLAGAMWSITTHPLRGPRGRLAALERNLVQLQGQLAEMPGRLAIASTASEYRAARNDGRHVILPAVQGGNVFEANTPPNLLSQLVRVTLVHLMNSCHGATSSPLGSPGGMTASGLELVRHLDDARVFVDLAHVHAQGFWHVMAAHDPTLPVLVTHTGVDGVRPLWRNLDDDQIRAVAATGGVVGVLFETHYLRPRGRRSDIELVLAHIEHIIDVGGEAAASIGSDFDGFIHPPRSLRDGQTAYYRLTDAMLHAGWSVQRIQGVLGGNFLRAFEEMRP